MRSRPASISASLRQWRSFARITAAMPSPVSAQRCSSAAARPSV
jgi:hypothetical protein